MVNVVIKINVLVFFENKVNNPHKAYIMNHILKNITIAILNTFSISPSLKIPNIKYIKEGINAIIEKK